MKTSIKNLIAACLTLVVLTSASNISKADDKVVTVLSEVKKVNKISVSGNVDLVLVQSNNESVKVYDDYYTKNALVQQKDGELRISSYEKEALKVVVYVTNLLELNASDNAKVETVGKFGAIQLDVNAKDNAIVSLNTYTAALSTTIEGNAVVNLSGSTIDYQAVVSNLSKVNTNSFVAENTDIRSKNNAQAFKVAFPVDAFTAE